MWRKCWRGYLYGCRYGWPLLLGLLFVVACSDRDNVGDLHKRIDSLQVKLIEKEVLVRELLSSGSDSLGKHVVELQQKVKALEAQLKTEHTAFIIDELAYSTIEKKFLPYLKVDGRVIAIECSCPQKMVIKLELKVLDDHLRTVGLKTMDVVAVDGIAQLSTEIALHYHGVKSKDLSLRWTLLAWYPVQPAEIRSVTLKE